MQQMATKTQRPKMASAHLSDTKIQLINNRSRKIARCRSNMTTIQRKMDGSKRTLAAHPANDTAANKLAQYLKEINAQYW